MCGYKLDIMEGWHIHLLSQQIVIQIDAIADNLLKATLLYGQNRLKNARQAECNN